MEPSTPAPVKKQKQFWALKAEFTKKIRKKNKLLNQYKLSKISILQRSDPSGFWKALGYGFEEPDMATGNYITIELLSDYFGKITSHCGEKTN